MLMALNRFSRRIGITLRLGGVWRIFSREMTILILYLASQDQGISRLYGFSHEIQHLHSTRIPELGNSRAHVLVIGETGTGKEGIVGLIQEAAGIPRERLVSVNCAAIPENLAESELFGHVKGAFTGANSEKRGYFEMANDGALFLDEFGELPEYVQAKLLRVMQTGEFFPLGGTKKRVSFRLFAATNNHGAIRDDIYWRFPQQIVLSPLRNRREDIFAVMRGFIRDRFEGRNADWCMAPTVIVNLLFSPWLGNVRELQNAMEASLERFLYWHESASEKAELIPFFYLPPRGNCPSFLDVPKTLKIWNHIVRAVRSRPRGTQVLRNDLKNIDPRYYGFVLENAIEGNDPFGGRRLFTPWDTSLQTFIEAMKLSWYPSRPLQEPLEGTPLASKTKSKSGTGYVIDISGSATVRYPVIETLISLLREFRHYWRIPQELMSFYNENILADLGNKGGSTSPSIRGHAIDHDEQPTIPDLTCYTEEGLLQTYYRHLAKSGYNTKASMARLADISPNQVARRLRKFGITKT